MDVRVGLWRRLSAKELMLLNCGVGEDSWVFWTARRSNQYILKEISPEYSLEGLMLKLKLWYFGHLMWIDPLEKIQMLGKIEGRRRKGQWRMRWLDSCIWLNRHEYEQTRGDSEGHGSLAHCSPWICKELDTSSVQFSSVAQSCPTLCDPMIRSMPDLPVHHQLPEFTQTHIHLSDWKIATFNTASESDILTAMEHAICHYSLCLY